MPLQLCLFSLPLSDWSKSSVILPPGCSLSLTCHKACLPAVKHFFLIETPWTCCLWGTQGQSMFCRLDHQTHSLVCSSVNHPFCVFCRWIAAFGLQPLSDGCFNLRYHRYWRKWFIGGSNHHHHLVKTPWWGFIHQVQASGPLPAFTSSLYITTYGVIVSVSPFLTPYAFARWAASGLLFETCLLSSGNLSKLELGTVFLPWQ